VASGAGSRRSACSPSLLAGLNLGEQPGLRDSAFNTAMKGLPGAIPTRPIAFNARLSCPCAACESKFLLGVDVNA